MPRAEAAAAPMVAGSAGCGSLARGAPVQRSPLSWLKRLAGRPPPGFMTRFCCCCRRSRAPHPPAGRSGVLWRRSTIGCTPRCTTSAPRWSTARQRRLRTRQVLLCCSARLARWPDCVPIPRAGRAPAPATLHLAASMGAGGAQRSVLLPPAASCSPPAALCPASLRVRVQLRARRRRLRSPTRCPRACRTFG